MSIYDSSLRVGNFTSSEIVALTKVSQDKEKRFLGPALTYIEKKNKERRLGRPLKDETNAKAMLWGKAVESICFEKLGLDYKLFSQETVQHPRINYWAGSADCIKYDAAKTIVDIKCPFTLESFCDLVQPLYDGLQGMEAMEQVKLNHKDGEKFYWQLVSNSIIHDTMLAELVVYMPYESELEEIKQAVNGNGQYYWLSMALPGELPFLPDNGYYKNINTIRFAVPDADKNFLYDQVLKAGKLLINNA